MKKILIALDYNPSAQKVAEIGYSMAKSMQAEVTLLHVLADYTYYSSLDYSPIMGFNSFNNFDFSQMVDQQELAQTAGEFLNNTRNHLDDASIMTLLKEGDSSDKILEAAEEIHADLIVLGTHSRGGIENILMGSVAKNVVGKSQIPLLVIPIQEEVK